MKKTLENMGLILYNVDQEMNYDKNYQAVKTLMNTYNTLLSKFRSSRGIDLDDRDVLLKHKDLLSKIYALVQEDTTIQLTNGEYKSSDTLAEIDRRIEVATRDIRDLTKERNENVQHWTNYTKSYTNSGSEDTERPSTDFDTENLEMILTDKGRNRKLKDFKISLTEMINGKPVIRIYKDSIYNGNDYLVDGNRLIPHK